MAIIVRDETFLAKGLFDHSVIFSPFGKYLDKKTKASHWSRRSPLQQKLYSIVNLS